MGGQVSKAARPASTAAKAAATAAGAPPPPPMPAHTASPFPANAKLPPGWNPDAPRGERRPKYGWEMDMSSKPKPETIEFQAQEDLKMQMLAKDFATRGPHIDRRPTRLPSTPEDVSTPTPGPSDPATRPASSATPILQRRRLNEALQAANAAQLSAPAAGLLTLDQLTAVWDLSHSAADLAAATGVPEAKINALRKFTSPNRVEIVERNVVGVWASAPKA
ncbi:hypothetical protein H9P43_005352 [Blastocladiella emersonii ATCC 22665]|nr:hypothetical protein H9P43_005352 [Blastocladiella emersonii ATCC 22665]